MYEKRDGPTRYKDYTKGHDGTHYIVHDGTRYKDSTKRHDGCATKCKFHPIILLLNHTLLVQHKIDLHVTKEKGIIKTFIGKRHQNRVLPQKKKKKKPLEQTCSYLYHDTFHLKLKYKTFDMGLEREYIRSVVYCCFL